MPNAEDLTIRYAENLLRETREEVVRADTKASILFGAFGVAVGAVTAALIADDWSPSLLDPGIAWVWWSGAIAVAVAFGLLAAAVYPRVTHPEGKDLVAYFGHVVQFSSLAELADAIAVAAGDPVSRAIDQVWHLSRIANRKFCLTRWALRFLGMAAVLLGLSAWIDRLQ